MNKNKMFRFLISLALFVTAGSVMAQQFQPIYLIDWAPKNRMFPLTTTYLGQDGVQQYAEFDTAVYNLIDTTRAFTWLKPEMEAGNNVTIATNRTLQLADDNGTDSYLMYLNPSYFYMDLYRDSPYAYAFYDFNMFGSSLFLSNDSTQVFTSAGLGTSPRKTGYLTHVKAEYVDLYQSMATDYAKGSSFTSVFTQHEESSITNSFGLYVGTGDSTSSANAGTFTGYRERIALQQGFPKIAGNPSKMDWISVLFNFQDSTSNSVNLYNEKYRLLNGVPPHDTTLQAWDASGNPFWVQPSDFSSGGGPSTWLKPEMEGGNVSITSSTNTLTFDSGTGNTNTQTATSVDLVSNGGANYVNLIASTLPEIAIGRASREMTVDESTIDFDDGVNQSAFGTNQLSFSHQSDALPAYSAYDENSYNIVTGEGSGAYGSLTSLDTGSEFPSIGFNRGTWNTDFSTPSTALASGKTIGSIQFFGQNGTGFYPASNNYLSADIRVSSTELFSSTTGGSKMAFSTTGTGGNLKRDGLTLLSDSQIQLNEYGAGTYTGTATYLLAVNSSGEVIEKLESTPANIYNTSDALTGNRTVTTAANFLNFNIASGGTFYITDNFNNVDNNWTETGYYHNYTDGASVFSTMVGGLTSNEPYIQHVAIDASQQSEIQNVVRAGEMGFNVETQPDKGADSTDVNFYVGEFNDGSVDWPGLILSNSGTVANKLNGAYKHIQYETIFNTFRLFNDGLIFDDNQVPVITSGATSAMEWTGNASSAPPTVYRQQRGTATITATNGSVSVSFTAAMPSSSYSVQLTLEVVSGTPDINESVVRVASGKTTGGFTAELLDTLDGGEEVLIHWLVRN